MQNHILYNHIQNSRFYLLQAHKISKFEPKANIHLPRLWHIEKYRDVE